MSDPTYRIDVEHRPGEAVWPWKASVIRLSDESLITVKVGNTPEDACEVARQVVAEMNGQKPGFSLFVDDDGQRVEPMSTDFPGQPFGPGDTISHSVKA